MGGRGPVRGEFHRLRVRETMAETAAAKSVIFEVPPSLEDLFRWRAGQHITLRVEVGGAAMRRSYSISGTSLGGGPLRITVKRVPHGPVSNFINDRVTAGDTLDVMPPFGGFVLDADPSKRRTHYFFGAGSGITPLYAMLSSVLIGEPHSAAILLYGNTNAGTIIFDEDLARLEEGSRGHLAVRHILSAPSRNPGARPWRRGRIDAAAVTRLIDEHPPYAQDTQYYICGPGSMNATVRAALIAMDVPPARIHTEHYGPVTPPDDSVAPIAAHLTVRLNGRSLQAPLAPGQTILEAVRAAGASPPYSCESGVCGACRARLRDGAAHLRARMALSDAELSRNVILTCQALPTTPRVTVDYD